MPGIDALIGFILMLGTFVALFLLSEADRRCERKWYSRDEGTILYSGCCGTHRVTFRETEKTEML